MAYPSKCTMNWLEYIRQKSSKQILLTLFFAYLGIAIIFAVIYHNFVPLSNSEPPGCTCVKPGTTPPPVKLEHKTDDKSFLDSLYFSVITASTVGYGDLSPKNGIGKIAVIVQVILSTAFFALIISIAFLKILYPRNTIILSDKIIYNPETKRLSFRIINVNRAKLINPEIRVVMAEHTEEHGISHHSFIGKVDDLPCLGNHDFTLNFIDREDIVGSEISVARACEDPETRTTSCNR